MISMLCRFLDKIGLKDCHVNINTKGLPEDRQRVTTALKEYIAPKINDMCED